MPNPKDKLPMIENQKLADDAIDAESNGLLPEDQGIDELLSEIENSSIDFDATLVEKLEAEIEARQEQADELEEVAESSEMASPDISFIEGMSFNGDTLDIFLCGTSSRKEDAHNYEKFFLGENVSRTFHILLEEEFVSKFIVSGPGSDSKGVEELLAEYPKSGYADRDGRIFAYGMKERIDHLFNVIKILTTGDASFLKESIQVQRCELIAKLLAASKLIKLKRLRIGGWSRGAAGATTLTHRLYNDPKTRHLVSALFLYETVAGLALSNKSNRTLPPTVNVCYVIYVADERSVGFNCIIPHHHPGTILIPIVLPGGHAQVAGSQNDHKGLMTDIPNADITGVGLISRYIMQNLLEFHGAKFNAKKMSALKLSDLCGLFDNIQRNRDSYYRIATRVPYTVTQVAGNSRKVITGRAKYFNKEMNLALPANVLLNDKKHTYLNSLHEALDLVARQAKIRIENFKNAYQAMLDNGSPVSSHAVIDLLTIMCREEASAMNAFTHLPTARKTQQLLVIRALCEEFQQQFAPYDIRFTRVRFHQADKLIAYANQVLSTEYEKHNLCIQERDTIIAEVASIQSQIVNLNPADTNSQRIIENEKQKNMKLQEASKDICLLITLFNNNVKAFEGKIAVTGFKTDNTDHTLIAKHTILQLYKLKANIINAKNILAVHCHIMGNLTTDSIWSKSQAEFADKYAKMDAELSCYLQIVSHDRKKLKTALRRAQRRKLDNLTQAEKMAKKGNILKNKLAELVNVNHDYLSQGFDRLYENIKSTIHAETILMTELNGILRTCGIIIEEKQQAIAQSHLENIMDSHPEAKSEAAEEEETELLIMPTNRRHTLRTLARRFSDYVSIPESDSDDDDSDNEVDNFFERITDAFTDTAHRASEKATAFFESIEIYKTIQTGLKALDTADENDPDATSTKTILLNVLVITIALTIIVGASFGLPFLMPSLAAMGLTLLGIILVTSALGALALYYINDGETPAPGSIVKHDENKEKLQSSHSFLNKNGVSYSAIEDRVEELNSSESTIVTLPEPANNLTGSLRLSANAGR